MGLFSLALAGLALMQSGTMSGSWTAEYGGTTYVHLVLESGAAPRGTMSIGRSIHVDEKGNVDGATPAPSALAQMLDVHRSGDVLSFGFNDGDQIDRFEFRLIDANHAELMLIMSEEQRQQLADDRIPLPKPFPLTRMRDR